MGAVRTLVDELRRRGVTVHEWSGWDGRGMNGVTQINPHGAVLHHTATGYGSAFSGLVSSTRSDMLGATLCNFAGNSDGSLTVIASGRAWHAGAGAGPALGPLYPYRGNMNDATVGLEIVYPGDQPMTDEQYSTALVFSRAVADLFGGGDIECVRAHAETNGYGGDGKWDPGYAPGRTIDMAAFRRDAATATKEDDLSAAAEEQIRQIYVSMSRMAAARGIDIGDAFVSMYDSLKPVAVETGPKGADGKTPTLAVRPNEAAANVYAMTFFGSNYGFGEAIVKQLAEATGGTIDIDEDALARHINGSIAPVVAQAVVEVALPAIREVMGEDNKDQAQAVVDLIRQKLGGAA